MPFSKIAFLSLIASLFLNQRGEVGGTETPEEKKAREDKEAADKKAADDKKASEDFNSLPEWAQKTIKDLRKESAGHRTENKTLAERMDKFEKGLKGIFGEGDDDKRTPEEKLQELTASNEAATVENTILALAVDNGVTKEEMKYFKFLVNEKLETLKDDEELTEEQVAELALEAKGKSAPAGKGPANSSVNNGQGGKGGKAKEEVTAEQFKKMGLSEKTKLYRENPELYNKLFNEVGI